MGTVALHETLQNLLQKVHPMQKQCQRMQWDLFGSQIPPADPLSRNESLRLILAREARVSTPDSQSSQDNQISVALPCAKGSTAQSHTLAQEGPWSHGRPLCNGGNEGYVGALSSGLTPSINGASDDAFRQNPTTLEQKSSPEAILRHRSLSHTYCCVDLSPMSSC
jgi:hypothetical protein